MTLGFGDSFLRFFLCLSTDRNPLLPSLIMGVSAIKKGNNGFLSVGRQRKKTQRTDLKTLMPMTFETRAMPMTLGCIWSSEGFPIGLFFYTFVALP